MNDGKAPGIDLAADGNVGDLLDIALVERLVADQFPQWADLPVTAVEHNGWDNRTFRLGDELSVRLPSAAGYVGQVAKEHRWLPGLARQLPLPIPSPVGLGSPGQGYPYPWSVYQWLPGRPLITVGVRDRARLARDLAAFLRALRQADAEGGPAPGRNGGYRGGPVAFYGAEARRAIEVLAERVDGAAAAEVWRRAETAIWTGPPVWVHGDVAAGNLLMADDRLVGVIDFGSSAVGDPAADVVPAWTIFDAASRAILREMLGLDDAAWARGRGWALWKSVITLASSTVDPESARVAAAVIDTTIADLEER